MLEKLLKLEQGQSAPTCGWNSCPAVAVTHLGTHSLGVRPEGCEGTQPMKGPQNQIQFWVSWWDGGGAMKNRKCHHVSTMPWAQACYLHSKVLLPGLGGGCCG